MFVMRKDIYGFFVHMKTRSPLVFYTLTSWLLLELVFALVLPALLGDALYFQHYVPDKAKEATARFLRNENANIPDSQTGWRNKPDVQINSWVIDRYGSRSSRSLDLQHKAASQRAVFFGSSMVNGGEGVSNHETISAQIESAALESFNFASMAFSLDQSLLMYRQMADKLQADYVVAGLDADPIEGLYNHYIPLKLREEVGVPYLKPRFHLDNGELRLVEIDPGWLAQLDEPGSFVDFLRQSDRHFGALQQYQRCGLTPLAHGICWIRDKLDSTLGYMQGGARASDPLLEAIVSEFDTQVKARNGRLLVLLFPSERMFHWGGIWKYFPDVYALRLQALQDQGIDVVDVRALFRASGASADQLFADDRHHFSATGNKVIADGLLGIINR